MSEVIYCHYEAREGVSVALDTPRVFTVSADDRAKFDEWATNWNSKLRAGVLIWDDATGEAVSVFKHSCGLGCECAAIYELHRNLSITVGGK
jgi:hypothetical protein